VGFTYLHTISFAGCRMNHFITLVYQSLLNWNMEVLCKKDKMCMLHIVLKRKQKKKGRLNIEWIWGLSP